MYQESNRHKLGRKIYMSRDNKLVSIIVPVYNVELYLNKCVESIVHQTYDNLEIILVDDGSKDSSSLICDELKAKDKRIVVLHNINGGLSNARNSGLKIARGDYIGFVDSDDYIDEDMIEKMVEEFSNPSVDLVSCGVKTEYSFRNEERCYSEKFCISSNVAIKHLLIWDGKVKSYACGKLFKKEVIKNVIFDETLLYGEDTPFNIFALLNCNQYSQIGTTYYHYVRRSDSLIGDEFSPKHMFTLTAAEKVHDYCINNRKDLISYSICNIAMNCFFLVERLKRAKQWKKRYLSEYKTLIKKMRSIPPFNVCKMHSRKTGLKWIRLAYIDSLFVKM